MTWDKNLITYKSSLIVDGLPNCVAVDRSKLKHIIQTRVLFKISRSSFSVLGNVVGTWCKFKSVAILKESFMFLSHRRHHGSWPNRKTSVQPASVFFPSPRRYRVDAHKYISLAQLDRFPAINQGISSGMLGKMHRYWIYFWFFWIISWGDSAYCETRSMFDPNASIKYKLSVLTDSEQEWTSGKGRCRGVEHRVQERNKRLRNVSGPAIIKTANDPH